MILCVQNFVVVLNKIFNNLKKNILKIVDMFLMDIHKIDCYFIHVSIHPSFNNYNLYFINNISKEEHDTVHQFIQHKLSYFHCIYEHLKIDLEKFSKILDNQANTNLRNIYLTRIQTLKDILSIIFNVSIHKNDIILHQKRINLSNLVKNKK